MSSDRNGSEVFSGVVVVMTGTTNSLDNSDGCCNDISSVEIRLDSSDALLFLSENTDNFIGRRLVTCFMEFCALFTIIVVNASATMTALFLKNSC